MTSLVTATTPGAESYSYTTGTNRLASFTDAAGTRSITYDARGNTLTETRPGSVSVATAYDGHGRLLSYARTGDPSQANVYNGLDDRVRVTSGSTTRAYVFDADGRMLGEYDTSAADPVVETIWLSPEVASGNAPFGGNDGTGGYAPLAIAGGSGTNASLYWVHGNHLGVPIAITDTSGAAATPTGYTAVGFPGQTRTLADLYYNRYRDYDTTTGRYIQADPIGLEGDANLYLYADGNPLKWTDPWGLEKAILFSPMQFNQDHFIEGALKEPNYPGICAVYGHMSPEGVEVWINGKKVYIKDPLALKRELMKRGCKPKQPVHFLGCRAGQGDNSFAERYARANNVKTIASDQFTWWKKDGSGYNGTFDEIGPPKHKRKDPSRPGKWKVFIP